MTQTAFRYFIWVIISLSLYAPYTCMHCISTRWYRKSNKISFSCCELLDASVMPKHMKFQDPQVAISIHQLNHGSLNLHWSIVACQRSPSNGFHGLFQSFIFLSSWIGPSICSLVGLKVLKAVTTKNVVTPCSPVDVHRRFGGTCLQHQCRSNESANRVVFLIASSRLLHWFRLRFSRWS